MNASRPVPAPQPDRVILVTAWAAMLLVSDLWDIVLHFFTAVPAWIIWVKIGFAVLFLLASLGIQRLRTLRPFALVVVVFYLLQWFSGWAAGTEGWARLFGGRPMGFVPFYLSAQMQKLISTIVIVGLLFLLLRSRREFFLAKGQLAAPTGPVRWLGIRPGGNWKTFGWIFTACFFGGSALVLLINAFSRPIPFARLLPLLPFVLLFSAANSFNEELTYRASMLSTTHTALGDSQALWLSSVFFGLAHFVNGTPNGVFGFALTGFLAYMYGKSMLETCGSGWAWFMHMVCDLPIFTLFALSSLR